VTELDTERSVNDSEHELREDVYDGKAVSPDAEDLPQRGLDDLSPAASDRIRQFMAESTVRGGASPGDVADLYTAQEIVDDDDATSYLDRRFVHGDVPTDWRSFQDELSTAYLDGLPGTTGAALLAQVREQTARMQSGRSIFDDPEDDELDEYLETERIKGRDPNLTDLAADARRAIERHIISDVLCYGVAPYKVMQLREQLRADGDERGLQYLDLPFELGDRPADWDGLRDRALMARARLESLGIDSASVFGQVDAAHPEADAAELLRLLEERDHRR
jgi:hypothetical protein